MTFGDVTLASSLLALVTFVLPIGVFATVLLAKGTWRTARMDLLNGVAAVRCRNGA